MARSPEKEALGSLSVDPYNPAWVQWFQEEGSALAALLPQAFLAFEHIGSTAIPGLEAKPIVDMMAAVASIDHCEPIVAQLVEYGYCPIDAGMPRRLFFRRRSLDGRIFHLHVVEMSSWETRKERLMRDYLRVHPELARAYGLLKKTLAQECAHDSLLYTRRKTPFIQQLMDQYFAERGLPSSDVWEE